MAKAREWLTSNPIRDAVNIQHLRKAERDLRAKLTHVWDEHEDKAHEKQTEEVRSDGISRVVW